MAKFTVTNNRGDVAAYEGEYSFDEGVLTIQPEVGNKIHLSPTGWLLLETREPDSP